MSVLYVLVPAALLLVAAAVAAFAWAAGHGQFDDTTTPAIRVALDDDGIGAPVPRERRPKQSETIARARGQAPTSGRRR